MPTTFHVTNFKNKVINMLTGASAVSPTPLAFIVPYNGAQPSDPSISPAGTPVYSSISLGIPINGFMQGAAGGVSQLVSSRQANASSTVSSLAWARIYDSSQQAMIDATVGTGVGGVILDSLSSFVGNPLTCTKFSLKLPSSNATLMFSASLQDRMVDVWTGNSSTRPDMGANATIDIYSGSAPGTADLPATGTKLASFVGNAVNWFTVAANASAQLALNPVATASATGTAGYFRWYKTVSNITFTVQGTVGTSNADILLNTVDLVNGVTSVSIVEATLSL